MRYFYKKGSIQRAEDLKWYKKNKKEFDDQLKRNYVSKSLNFETIKSRTGKIKEIVVFRGEKREQIYSIKKIIRKAETYYSCFFRDTLWNFGYSFNVSFPDIEKAKKFIKQRIVINESRNLYWNILLNKELFSQSWEDAIGEKFR